MGKIFLLVGIFLFLNCFLAYRANALIIKSNELALLKKGEIVQKSLTAELRDGLKGSESKILINAPVEKVWRLLDEKENLPKFISYVKSAKVVSERNELQKVDTTIELCKLLPTFQYTLLFDRSEKYKTMKFKKVDGAFKELYGYFEMIPYNDKTIFAYRIYSDPGFYIPKIVLRAMGGNAEDIMKSVKREAEK